MAAISGKAGLVEWGAGKAVLGINSFSLDVGTNMVPITSWTTGTDQWEAVTPGLSNWSGSFSGVLDSASTVLQDLRGNVLTPASATLKLYMDRDGGENYNGTAYVDGWNISADIEGSVDVSANFRGTGALTHSTTT